MSSEDDFLKYNYEDLESEYKFEILDVIILSIVYN